MNTIEIIQGYKPDELFNKIWNEKPETVARILLCMEYSKAPEILKKFSLQSQISILVRINDIKEINLNELAKMDELLTGQPSSSTYENGIAKGGIEAVVEILNLTHRDTYRKIMANLEETHPEFADEILKRMFVFEDIVMLDDDFAKTALSMIDDHDLAIALKGVDVEIQDWVFRKMANTRALAIKNEMYEMGPMREAVVKEAQIKIFWFIRKLGTSEEAKAAKPSSPETLIKRIEEALVSGELDIVTYFTDVITPQDMRDALQSRRDDLQKIWRLKIMGKDLSAAAPLFEGGKIEELEISGEFDGELPSSIRSASSLRSLSIVYTKITSLPDWIGDLHSLAKLSLSFNERLETLPSSIGSLENLDDLYILSSPAKSLPDNMGILKNLRRFVLKNSFVEKLPDWSCAANGLPLQSLTELTLVGNNHLKALPDSIGDLKNLQSFTLDGSPVRKLPDSMGNLKNLQFLYIHRTHIEEIPDCIGRLHSLKELLLPYNNYLKTLPDNIGNLGNLVYLDISDSLIEKLPDTIVECTALESVNINGTRIYSVPDFIKSIKNFNDNTLIEKFPALTSWRGGSVSYRCFCNSYYRLAETILAFNDKARREGLLALEEELEYIAEDFFKIGMRLVVDGTDAVYIRKILQTKLEREHDFYRKKLMEVAMEGILKIQAGDSPRAIALLLASLVDIENNPLAAACANYYSGETGALDNIDFSAAIEDEDEREELRFIKRTMELSEISRREGLLALEEHIDHDGIAARDVFEYGIVLAIDGWDTAVITKILDNLIEHETDPVKKNISQAKKEAVLLINDGINPRILVYTLCAFFDEGIAGEISKLLDD